jgi:hypothetical protein
VGGSLKPWGVAPHPIRFLKKAEQKLLFPEKLPLFGEKLK